MEGRALALPSSCQSLSGADAHIQPCGRPQEVWQWSQSSTIAKPRTVFFCTPAEMHQPWRPSHSKGKMGAPCFLRLRIHRLWQRPLSRDWGDKSASRSGVCPHLSILTFPAAEKVVLIHGGHLMLSKMFFQSPWPGEDFLQSAQAFESVFSDNLLISSRGPETEGIQLGNGCPVIQTRSSALNVHDFKSPELHFFKCVLLFFFRTRSKGRLV